MSEEPKGYRANLYLRNNGEDLILCNALKQLPRGSARKLILEAVRALIPGAYSELVTAEDLARELKAVCDGEYYPSDEADLDAALHNLADQNSV